MTMNATTNGEVTKADEHALPETTSRALARSAPTAMAPAPFDAEAFRMQLEPAGYDQAGKLAASVFAAKMFKTRDVNDALVRIMTGRALGLPAFASLSGLFSFDGTVGIYAKVKVALARRRPECEYIRCTERSATKATYVAKRRGEDAFSLTFTIEEAKTAGLLAKDNWKNWPADMCMARASSKIVDIVFPEACLGLPSIEEVQDRTIDTTGDTVYEPPPQAAPPRDFAAEAQALQDEIASCATPETRKSVRGKVAKFLEDAPDLVGASVKEFYNFESAKWKAQAQAAAPVAPELFGK